MNRRLSFIILAIAWMAFWFFWMPKMQAQNGEEKPAPAVMLQQAQEKETAAGDNVDALSQVIKKDYQSVIKTHPKTEEAAQARLRIAVIQETKLGPKHRQNAVHSYQGLLRDFSPEESTAAKDAQARLTNLEHEIDKGNSGHILYRTLDFLVKATGSNKKYSYALALLLITLVFKLLTTPLSHLQFKYMREMQKIQPLVKELQVKYKNNQKELGPKVMDLYKEHGVNPFSSCLPILVQLPVLWLLYSMVRLYQFQFAGAEFLWIGSSLAERFPGIVATSLAYPDIPLLIIYTISMIISQKISIVDPTQAEQQKIMAFAMPIVFAFLFKSFPAAFMLYWLFFNIVSTTQQYFILRKPITPEGPVLGPTNGAKSVSGNGAHSESSTDDVTPVQPKKLSTSPGKAKRRKKR